MATETAAPLISQNERWRILLHAFLFVAGFSTVFIIGWGGSVTLVGQVFVEYKRGIAQLVRDTLKPYGITLYGCAQPQLTGIVVPVDGGFSAYSGV